MIKKFKKRVNNFFSATETKWVSRQSDTIAYVDDDDDDSDWRKHGKTYLNLCKATSFVS